MSKILATFSGKYGDILWSLATVQRLSEMLGTKLDFATMPQYKDLWPLIGEQPYIDKTIPIPNWSLMHSNYGDQPWNPPNHIPCINAPGGGYPCKAGWDFCYHLGYREHPGKIAGHEEVQLIDFVPKQQGVAFIGNPLPFLHPKPLPSESDVPYVAIAFNDQYKPLKDRFIAALKYERLVWVDKFPWAQAAQLIKGAVGFIGCRSANYVMAHGVGQRVFVYEPHPARNKDGYLGLVFGCSYGKELCAPLLLPPEAAAAMADDMIGQWSKEDENAAIAS